MPAPLGHEPYNKNGEGGRKKIYTAEFIEAEAIALENWMAEKKENIFIEDFCIERGYNDSRLFEWEKVNERFSDAYKAFKMRQKVALFKGGLTKTFSFPMCALLLSHAHDVVAKSEPAQDKNQQHITYNVNYGSSKQVLPPNVSNPNS